MPKPEDYLKPEIIKQIARLDFKARFIIQGFISGLHASPYHGFSVEFSEHRKYVFGDDPKDLDWKVFAKTDKYYVKKFQAETNLQCFLVLDISKSMDYRYGSDLTKLEYAIYLAASLAYLMVSQQDAVGLVTFDDRIRTYLPPRSKTRHLTDIIASLAACRPSARTDIMGVFSNLDALIKKKALVIVFSDLLFGRQDVFSSLMRLRFRGHEVVVFHILDYAEVRFPFSEPAKFRDPETGREVETDARVVKGDYLESLDRHCRWLRNSCRESRIDYQLIDTSISFDRALLQYLLVRKAYG